MGDQLWTSRITGYRRRGTRLAELLPLLGGSVVLRAILEPLQSVALGSSASEMRGILDNRGFDVAGVQESRDGPVLGFVIRENLRSGTIGEYLKRFSDDDLITDQTTIPQLFAILGKTKRAFVTLHREVRGIVTHADLNKPPIRVYLFGLISLLEMHLQFWVSEVYPNGSWEKGMQGARLDTAIDLQARRRQVDGAISLFDCLQFADKAQLVTAQPKMIDTLALGSKSNAKKLLGKAERLRNDLAHSQLDLVHGTSWAVLLDQVQAIEKLIHRSDQIIEEKFRQPDQSRQGGLWVFADR